MTKVDSRDRFLVDEMLRHLNVLAAGVKEGKANLAEDTTTRTPSSTRRSYSRRRPRR